MVVGGGGVVILDFEEIEKARREELLLLVLGVNDDEVIDVVYGVGVVNDAPTSGGRAHLGWC